METFKNPLDLAQNLQSTDVIYKFPNYNENVSEGRVRLYHQTTVDKLKQILKDKYIKGDVWSQENVNPEDWRYGDLAIAFDVEPSAIHKANQTDRIIYGNVPIDSFSHIKSRTARTPQGIEKFKQELEGK